MFIAEIKRAGAIEFARAAAHGDSYCARPEDPAAWADPTVILDLAHAIAEHDVVTPLLGDVPPVAPPSAPPLTAEHVADIRNASAEARRVLARMLARVTHSWALSSDAKRHARATPDLREQERGEFVDMIASALDALEVVDMSTEP